jgi:hypothetical protein
MVNYNLFLNYIMVDTSCLECKTDDNYLKYAYSNFSTQNAETSTQKINVSGFKDAQLFNRYPYYYNRVACTGDTKKVHDAKQHMILKQMQHTVRVPSSLYMMSLKSLTSTGNYTPWNNQSDRQYVHGKGVDIKHGSYERYLNKMKGKNILRKNTKDIYRTSIIECPCNNYSDIYI